VYAKIKVPNTSPAHKYTQHKIPNIRIKDEIKYLHNEISSPIRYIDYVIQLLCKLSTT